MLSSPTYPTFYFIGVSTAYSSSRKMFPLWMEALGHPEVRWQGLDLPIHADPEVYRDLVAHIKETPNALGALVTTHKIDLLEASRDMFDELGPYATVCQEVSSIAKDGPKLIGQATDPLASGLSLQAFVEAGYFGRAGAEVLCLGAGGSAVAISLNFIQQTNPADRPRGSNTRTTAVNRSLASGPHDRIASGRLDRPDTRPQAWYSTRSPLCPCESSSWMMTVSLVTSSPGSSTSTVMRRPSSSRQ